MIEIITGWAIGISPFVYTEIKTRINNKRSKERNTRAFNYYTNTQDVESFDNDLREKTYEALKLGVIKYMALNGQNLTDVPQNVDKNKLRINDRKKIKNYTK